MLEAIKVYGQTSASAALLIDGEELIPAGRSNWLHFVWLSQQQDQQRRVYAYRPEVAQAQRIGANPAFLVLPVVNRVLVLLVPWLEA